MEKFQGMLQKNEIYPMMEGTGEWSEVFRSILLEGATSQHIDNEMDKKDDEEKSPITLTQALAPQDEEFKAAVAELCHEGARKFYPYPACKTNTCKSFAGNSEPSLSWL